MPLNKYKKGDMPYIMLYTCEIFLLVVPVGSQFCNFTQAPQFFYLFFIFYNEN